MTRFPAVAPWGMPPGLHFINAGGKPQQAGEALFREEGQIFQYHVP
jgi:hypothetical protein